MQHDDVASPFNFENTSKKKSNLIVRKRMCAQRRLKSACASAHSDQSICYPHEENLRPWLSKMRPVKILVKLRERASLSESSLGAHVQRYVFWRCGWNNWRISLKGIILGYIFWRYYSDIPLLRAISLKATSAYKRDRISPVFISFDIHDININVRIKKENENIWIQ